MGFSWARPTTFDEPTFEVGNHVLYYAVDHSPSYLWNSATWDNSNALIPFIRPVLEGSASWDADETLTPRHRDPRRSHRQPEHPGLPGAGGGDRPTRSSDSVRPGRRRPRPPPSGRRRHTSRRRRPGRGGSSARRPRMIAAPGSSSQGGTECWQHDVQATLGDGHGVHRAGAQHPQRRRSPDRPDEGRTDLAGVERRVEVRRHARLGQRAGRRWVPAGARRRSTAARVRPRTSGRWPGGGRRRGRGRRRR